MPKFCFVTGGHHLKLSNSVLIELRGSPAGQFVLIREAVNQKASVVRALTKDRRGGITIGICLAVDGYSRNKLKQVEIISPVDGHILNFFWKNSRALGGRRSFEKRDFAGYVNGFFDGAEFQLDVEGQRPIQRDFQGLKQTGAETRVRNIQGVNPSSHGRELVVSFVIRSNRLRRSRGIAGKSQLRVIDRQTLLVGHRALNCGSGLRPRAGRGRQQAERSKHGAKDGGQSPPCSRISARQSRCLAWNRNEHVASPPSHVARIATFAAKRLKGTVAGYCRSGESRCQGFYAVLQGAFHANNKCCE